MKTQNPTKSYNLKFFVNKIKKGEPFSIARYGDGELYCMEGREGANSHGCEYLPELREDLIKSLRSQEGLYHLVSSTMLPEDKVAFSKYKDNTWGDTEIFPEALKKGELKAFFDAIKKYPIVIISSEEKRKVPLPYEHFIETPLTNTYLQKERILGEVLGYGKPAIYLFSCGLSAGVLVSELHNKISNAWFLDIGHILDPLIGIMSRDYLLELSHEQIFRNL